MKILLAPDKFKASLTAREVCAAMEVGLRRVAPQAEIVSVPMADGGDGTVQALVDATSGEFIVTEVTGPLGEPVSARWGMLGDEATAVIEMAEASGFKLVPADRRNPLITTTYGTGELIRAALERGARKLIIGIGGSATNDGGAGCAQALGARLLDDRGNELPWGGGALSRLARIDASQLATRNWQLEVVVACDVDNPLTGARGASMVFGYQKGATGRMIKDLDAALTQYARIVQRDLDRDVQFLPGAGAAGGLGAGLVAFLDAKLQRGVEIVIEAVGLREQMRDAQLVFTGEGRMDAQTAGWKAPMGVARLARELGIPVAAVVGSLSDDFVESLTAASEIGLNVVVPLVRGGTTLEDAMRNPHTHIAEATIAAWHQVREQMAELHQRC